MPKALAIINAGPPGPPGPPGDGSVVWGDIAAEALASNAETIAGVIDTKAVSPAGLSEALTSFFPVVPAAKYGVSASASASQNSDGIDEAIDVAKQSAERGLIYLPPGVLSVERSIVLETGVGLIGAGQHWANGRPGTTLDGTGVSDPIITTIGAVSETTDWSHAILLTRLQVRHAEGHGIVLHTLGEGAYVDLVAANYCGGDGIRVEGPSTPLHLGHLSVHFNGGVGVRLVDQFYAAVQILYIGGDDNGECLWMVDGLSPLGMIKVDSWKSERSDHGDPVGYIPGHDNVVILKNLNLGHVDCGMGHVIQGTNGDDGNAVILETTEGGGGTGTCKFHFSHFNGSGGDAYEFGYQNTHNGLEILLADAVNIENVSQLQRRQYGRYTTSAPSMTQTQIGGAGVTPGMMVYNRETGGLEVTNGQGWQAASLGAARIDYLSSSSVNITGAHMGRVLVGTNSATTLTLPTNASQPIPIGSQFEFFQYYPGAQMTIAAAGGVDLRSAVGTKTRGQWAKGRCRKIWTDEWLLEGDLTT